MTTQQPDVLRLAQHLEQFRSFPDDLAAAKELRRLHARVQELEASQAQRVPLSDAEIRDLYSEEVHWDMVAPYVIAFARSIEAAHGITQEKQG